MRVLPEVLGSYVPEVRAPKKPAYRGYDVNRKSKVPTLLTDEQVAQARWLYEFGGWTRAQVMDKFGLTDSYTRRLMSYATRSKVFVTQDSFPAGFAP